MQTPAAFLWDGPVFPYTDSDDERWIDILLRQGTEERPLELFQHIPEYSPRRTYEAPEFEAIGLNNALERVFNGHLSSSEEGAVWLHDQGDDGDRDYNGVMSIQKFHQVYEMKV
jgi:hypothetical protein